METFFYCFLSYVTDKKRYLRNKHNTNGDSSHEITLKILTPFIYPNPTRTRNQELNPFKPRHSTKLRGEPRNRDIRRQRIRRRRKVWMLHRDDSDRTSRHGCGGGKVGVTVWCEGCWCYLHVRQRRCIGFDRRRVGFE